MTDETRIRVMLAICPRCKTPAVTVDGQARDEFTFWMRNGQPMTTPHSTDCSFRGKPLPDN